MLNLRGMDGNDPDTIHLAADAHAIPLAVAAARHFAATRRLDADTAASLAIIVEELITNLVEHGGAPGTPISLRLERRPDAVELTIVDRGVRFDPRDAVASFTPPQRGGGVGIALVLAWARIIDYRSGNGANHLSLSLPVVDEARRDPE